MWNLRKPGHLVVRADILDQVTERKSVEVASGSGVFGVEACAWPRPASWLRGLPLCTRTFTLCAPAQEAFHKPASNSLGLCGRTLVQRAPAQMVTSTTAFKTRALCGRTPGLCARTPLFPRKINTNCNLIKGTFY